DWPEKLRGNLDVAHSRHGNRFDVSFVIEKCEVQHEALIDIHDQWAVVVHLGKRAEKSPVDFLRTTPGEHAEGRLRWIYDRTIGIVGGGESVFPAGAAIGERRGRSFLLRKG